MIEKEKIVSWIKGNGWLFAFLGFLLSFIPIIKALLAVLGGIMAKMTSDIFLGIIGIILLLGAIISFILWIRQRWTNRLKKKEEELNTLKSKSEEETKQLEENMKQYGELVKKVGSGLEEKIQLPHNLEYEAQHNKREEPKITVWQKFSNASDFEFKIKRIDTIAKLTGGPEIERFHYDESDNIFFDQQKLFFPEKIAPLDLFNNEIKYRINDITKLAKAFPNYKNRAFLIEIEQAIEFATQATTTPKTVNKTIKKTVNIQPKDWKGGRR